MDCSQAIINYFDNQVSFALPLSAPVALVANACRVGASAQGVPQAVALGAPRGQGAALSEVLQPYTANAALVGAAQPWGRRGGERVRIKGSWEVFTPQGPHGKYSTPS